MTAHQSADEMMLMSQEPQVTEEEACEFLDMLEKFCKDSMNPAATDVPGLDDVKFAFAGLILWFGFDEQDYEIRDLIRIFENRKGISYSVLIAGLRPVVEDARARMNVFKARRTPVSEQDDVPF